MLFIQRFWWETFSCDLEVTNEYTLQLPQNSENKPQGLYFSKALFEGVIFGGAKIQRGFNLRREICVSKSIGLVYIVRHKFTVFALFYFVYLRAIIFSKYKHQFGGLIFGEDYTWRGLFSEFYGI